MRRPSIPQRRLVILTLAVLTFALAFYGGSRYQDPIQSPPVIAGVAIHPPSPLPDLPHGEDAPLRHQALAGHWSLLMLDPREGRMRAPALQRLLQVHNRLAVDPQLQAQMAFLYLPKALDTEQRTAIGALGENIRVLTGSAGQVSETFRRLGVAPDGDTAALYLIGPQARLHALFTPDQDIATIAGDLTTLITREP